MNERTKSRLGLAFRLLCVLATVVVLWRFLRGIDVDRFTAALRGADYRLLVLAVLLNVGAQFVRGASWTAMLGARHPVRFGTLLRYELAAQAASSLTPARAGEVMRLWMLRREGVPVTVTTALIVLKKSIGAVGVALLALPVPLLLGFTGWVPGVVLAITAAMVAHLALLVWVAHRKPGAKLPAFLRGLVDGMYFLRDRRGFAGASAWILLGEIADAAAAFVVLRALHMNLSFAAAILVLFFIDFANALPSAPAQLGTFEAGALYALGLLGVSPDLALAFTLVFHAQQAMPQIVVGLPFQLHYLAVRRTTQDSPTAAPVPEGMHG
ncbi:lysylphosphatidylglycerol synthase transmembrane domain-containing protein [Micromonospora sp. NPDC051141]|uniref:lysylphosphatidylglycerol synthase transmembrane domain-containing protein n=1 Tax=Micromonospora sp. NPDC051141 TaxID=3364284 RepID=UPI0037A26ABA